MKRVESTALQLKFPQVLENYGKDRVARLVAGTFSGGVVRQIEPFGPPNQPFDQITITFQAMANGHQGAREPLIIGTLNPTTITSGNHLVVLIVDVPDRGVLGQFWDFLVKKPGGGSHVLAIWAPQGESGRFLVEHHNYYISSALNVSKDEKLSCGIVVFGTLIVVALSCFSPTCVVCLLPIAIFVLSTYVLPKYQKKGILPIPEMRAELTNWVQELHDSGAMHKVFLDGMGVSTGTQGRL